MKLDRELAVACEAALAAGAVLREVYATDFAVDAKAPGDPVTEADRRANVLLCAALSEAFPADALCAEENSQEHSLSELRRGGRCWFLDPLDGTREFVDRNGQFCVMVGLAIDARPVLGVLYVPASDTLYFGGPTLGASSRRGSEAPVALRVREPEGPFPLACSRSHLDPRVAQVAEKLPGAALLPFGSVGRKVALVAEGLASLYLHLGGGPKVWDGCAPEALAAGAGALVTDASGAPLDYATALGLDRGLLVGPPALHARALRALGAA